MNNPLVKYLDIVYSFYGLSFIIMGVVIFSQLRIIRKSEFKLFGILWLLGWFGVIHGINEFIDMFAIIHGRALIFKIISPVFLISSFAFLFYFGCRLINLGRKRALDSRFSIAIAAMFLIFLFLAGITAESSWLNAGRYFLCFPGGLMSAIGLLLYYRNNHKELNKIGVRGYFISAASFFCLYAITGGLAVRGALTGIPVQCFRGVSALGIAFSVWNIMGLFDREEIEKLKKAEEVKSLSEIGALAATVAHELRNPLAAIGMAVHNIKRKAQNPALDKHLANIEKKVHESDQIIDNLLSYSRIRPPRYESVDIFGLIGESIDVIEENHKKEVSIIRDIDSLRGIFIEADSTQIEEVINNILNNACDAVPASGGRIEITGAREEGFIKVVIKDNGEGIDKENLKKIFDPFFTTKAKGTGLGLSVCQQIISLHGGSIDIQSEPGKGTSVTVSLPGRLSGARRILSEISEISA